MADRVVESRDVSFEEILGLRVQLFPFIIREEIRALPVALVVPAREGFGILSRGAAGPVGSHTADGTRGSTCCEIILGPLLWVLPVEDELVLGRDRVALELWGP